MKKIDLRSDTMTMPTAAMKAAMCEAPLGDDVWGEDPTVNQFQEEVADLLGKQAALFLPTATQANLGAIMSHCQRGEEYIVGNEAHCYRWEAGGAAVLGSVQPQPIPFEADGTLDLDKVVAHIKPDDAHHAITRLVCVENTMSGKVLPLEYLKQAGGMCTQHGLGLHMDGARAFNAAIALDVPISKIAKQVDTITLCLSKGLGCPAGALLVGNKDLITKAHRWRKMLGGSLRQAGMLAAAGQYALKHHVADLAQDHLNAKHLADGLRALNHPDLTITGQATNMLFVTTDKAIQPFAKQRGVYLPKGNNLRLVLHRDIQAEDIETVVNTIAETLATV